MVYDDRRIRNMLQSWCDSLGIEADFKSDYVPADNSESVYFGSIVASEARIKRMLQSWCDSLGIEADFKSDYVPTDNSENVYFGSIVPSEARIKRMLQSWYESQGIDIKASNTADSYEAAKTSVDKMMKSLVEEYKQAEKQLPER